MLLAIDTATNLAGIALLDGGGLPLFSREQEALGAGMATEPPTPARPPGYSAGRNLDSEVLVSDEMQTRSGGGPLRSSSRSSGEHEGLPRDELLRVRDAYQWQTGRNHTVELMPKIIRLLGEAGARAEELEAVAVAIGPGSYTGLRIGLSVAKGFCLAHGAALVAVPTLDISAMMCPPRDGLLCAMLQAGRGGWPQAFTARTLDSGRGPASCSSGAPPSWRKPAPARRPTLPASSTRPPLRTSASGLQGLAAFAPEGEWKRDPRVLARLGWERLRQGRRENLETLAPAYGQ